MNKAGYKPAQIPTNIGTISTGTRMLHLSRLFSFISTPVSLFIRGKQAQVKTTAIASANSVIITDSVRNCNMSSLFLAPDTLRMPISLARSTDLACN
jgi:hypothetical protein